ncbi:hypothetical protein AVEN_236749-1 [Araneus ventricosus]|uniref:Uncharacterized protein n=1 Tax=Araneus ventricosus TaxID=182803 RepID=A0A4Y2JBC2_ARAVE|nr:hypothetical protein AVEN_236749-1 [Araneus ventricosus]
MFLSFRSPAREEDAGTGGPSRQPEARNEEPEVPLSNVQEEQTADNRKFIDFFACFVIAIDPPSIYFISLIKSITDGLTHSRIKPNRLPNLEKPYLV